MATRKTAAKKPEPKAEPEPEAKPPQPTPQDTISLLLSLEGEVHTAALTTETDIVRTHLNNVESAIASLQDAIDQIASLDRKGPVRDDG